MRLLLGLGNIGTAYAHTRHNAGWDALDVFRKHLGAPNFRTQAAFHAEISEARLADHKVLLARPTLFMNRSGESLRALMQYYHLSADDVLLVHDEMDLAPGVWKCTVGGGAAGHNGIRSVHECLPDTQFTRFRLGVGRPTHGRESAQYVLERFSKDDWVTMLRVYDQAALAMEDWVLHDAQYVMNRWNAVARAAGESAT